MSSSLFPTRSDDPFATPVPSGASSQSAKRGKQTDYRGLLGNSTTVVPTAPTSPQVAVLPGYVPMGPMYMVPQTTPQMMAFYSPGTTTLQPQQVLMPQAQLQPANANPSFATLSTPPPQPSVIPMVQPSIPPQNMNLQQFPRTITPPPSSPLPMTPTSISQAPTSRSLNDLNFFPHQQPSPANVTYMPQSQILQPQPVLPTSTVMAQQPMQVSFTAFPGSFTAPSSPLPQQVTTQPTSASSPLFMSPDLFSSAVTQSSAMQQQSTPSFFASFPETAPTKPLPSPQPVVSSSSEFANLFSTSSSAIKPTQSDQTVPNPFLSPSASTPGLIALLFF